MIRQQRYDMGQFDHPKLDAMSFGMYEFENLELLPLLFQTGCLTIKHYDAEKQMYHLACPNYEVKTASIEC